MNKGVCIVTGASSGLGWSLATILCEKGYKVYGIARRKNLLDKLAKQSKEMPGEFISFSGDLSKAEFREKIISHVIKKNGKMDYLFNNAGFGRAIKLEKQDPAEISNMYEVNVAAYIHLAKLALKHMKKANSGRLIHTGSVVAFTPLPYFTVYNSTKSAVYGFNRSLRYELKGSKVTSTVVLPARMNTGFANVAFDCYEKKGRDMCVKEFNKIAGSPYVVAKRIVMNMDKGMEVITPTFKAAMWYTARYFGFLVDFVMKYFLGPKEMKHLVENEIKEEYKQKARSIKK